MAETDYINGNNCGHMPDQPRWFVPPPQHSRPKIIEKAIGEIRRYYREPAATIPSLNLANGSDRQQRSERREACLSVLGCLLHYLDLVTLRVGVPQNDTSFQGISMPFIAEKSGLTLKRTERAVRDLVKSGLITVHPLCEKISDTVYKGYAAIRTVSSKLFAVFGMSGRLRFERERATDRLKKRAKKEEQKGKAKIGLLLAGSIQDSSPHQNHPADKKTSALRSIKAILSSS
ncbi:MAG: replication protein RepA [Methylobacter sp.]